MYAYLCSGLWYTAVHGYVGGVLRYSTLFSLTEQITDVIVINDLIDRNLDHVPRNPLTSV